MLQVQRLAEYERYLGQEARNLVENGNGSVGSGAVLQRGQLEGDLHRIQELFPGDNLRLHERDVLTTVFISSPHPVAIYYSIKDPSSFPPLYDKYTCFKISVSVVGVCKSSLDEYRMISGWKQRRLWVKRKRFSRAELETIFPRARGKTFTAHGVSHASHGTLHHDDI